MFIHRQNLLQAVSRGCCKSLKKKSWFSKRSNYHSVYEKKLYAMHSKNGVSWAFFLGCFFCFFLNAFVKSLNSGFAEVGAGLCLTFCSASAIKGELALSELCRWLNIPGNIHFTENLEFRLSCELSQIWTRYLSVLT